jgi:4-hydroxyphenylpyruvate dioxygenase-like putative hemolysin
MVVGTSEFYGEIWKAMLRTPRARLSAIRYLEKRIPKDYRQVKKNSIQISAYTIRIIDHEVSLTKDPNRKKYEEHYKNQMDLQDYFYFYLPNKSTLVMNALIAGLSVQDS